MNEKLYDIPIDAPLTNAKRDKISRFIAENAQLFPAPVKQAWEDGAEPVLRLTTHPAVWEAHFHEQRVEVFGNVPRWASFLFTKKKRAQLKEQIEVVLQHAGFKTDSPVIS